jgi:DNA-binding PadR family transcriptional regulator
MGSHKVPVELLKGHTKTLILAVLKEGPSHGYAITHEIERRTEGAVAFRQGTLYPILHELEADEMVVGEWVAFGEERPKKVYRLTDKGAAELERGVAAWRQMNWAVFQVTGERAYESRKADPLPGLG